MIRAPHVLVLTLLLASCGGATDRSATGERSDVPLVPTTRDSAGITIHEHPVDALERASLITVDSVPMAVIGGPDDLELDLSNVNEPIFLANGNLALLASGSIWIHDAGGKLVERIGREGSGPQEFRHGTIAAGLADTIVMGDIVNARVALVVPGSGVIRTRPARFYSPRTTFRPAGQVGDDDFILVNAGWSFGPGADRIEVPVGRLAPGADSVTTLLPLAGPVLEDFDFSYAGGGPGKTVPMYASGEIAALWQGDLLVVRPTAWRIERLALDGTPRAYITVPRARRAATPEMRVEDAEVQINQFREMIATSTEQLQPNLDSTAMFNAARNQPHADSLAHFQSVATTPGGLAWLGEAVRMSDSLRHYTAVRPDGVIVGRLSLPRRGVILLGDDRVVLRQEDDDGFVTWQVHRLIMPGDQ
jgi:hypothetical protein